MGITTNQLTRQRIKIYLIVTNAILGVIFSVLLLFGILVIKPQMLDEAVQLGQYISLDLNYLERAQDTIKADYVGKHLTESRSNVASDIIEQESIMPKIGIIITNLGLNRHITEHALSMPKEIGLGFVPYTSKLKPLLYKAVNNGHEAYLYIPFETDDKSTNTTSYDLRTNLPVAENLKRLSTILNSQDKYIGVYTSHRETLSNDKEAISAVLNEIDSRKLFFIFGKNNAAKLLDTLDNTEKTIITSVLIDEIADPVLIRHNLKQLLQNAKKNGFALGYGQGYTITMDIITEWLSTLKSQNIELVPVSQLIDSRI